MSERERSRIGVWIDTVRFIMLALAFLLADRLFRRAALRGDYGEYARLAAQEAEGNDRLAAKGDATADQHD